MSENALDGLVEQVIRARSSGSADTPGPLLSEATLDRLVGRVAEGHDD